MLSANSTTRVGTYYTPTLLGSCHSKFDLPCPVSYVRAFRSTQPPFVAQQTAAASRHRKRTGASQCTSGRSRLLACPYPVPFDVIEHPPATTTCVHPRRRIEVGCSFSRGQSCVCVCHIALHNCSAQRDAKRMPRCHQTKWTTRFWLDKTCTRPERRIDQSKIANTPVDGCDDARTTRNSAAIQVTRECIRP